MLELYGEELFGKREFTDEKSDFSSSLLHGRKLRVTSKGVVERVLFTICTSVLLERTGSSCEQMQRQKTAARR